MPSLADTLKRLSRLAAERAAAGEDGSPGQLQSLASFGANPGALAARIYVPDALPADAPLVVVLHGCTQTAAGYDRGSGWSKLADQYGFALLFPEQQRANNPNLCFNWFSPEDSRRGAGEVGSIVQMIDTVIQDYAIDPARVYVTGLSAGGAMASVLLATHPERFAGGAIIAGLPFGAAASVPEAFDRMRGHNLPDASELARLVRAASDHRGPWPMISVWHGSADATVSPTNGTAVVDQWRLVHNLPTQPSRVEQVDAYPRRVWTDAHGRDVIEEFVITGMGHGTPLGTGGDDGYGEAGPFMLDVRISSTRHIAHFWDLDRRTGAKPADAKARKVDTSAREKPAHASSLPMPAARRADPIGRTPANEPSAIGKVIEDALRAAGLMR